MATGLDDKITLVKFLNFLCLGIIMPSIPPTILKLGGTHVHLGVMMSLCAVARMLSGRIYTDLTKVSGKQELLKFSILACSILNAALFMTSSVPTIVLNRVLFAFFNQVPMLCQQLSSKDSKESFYKNPQTQSLIAALMGLATVGSIIDRKGGFYVLVVIATSISGVAAAITHQLESKKGEKENKLTASKAIAVIPKTLTNTITAVRDIDIHFSNWDALLIKCLLISNATVVFILYVVLIILVFRGNGAVVCSTAAYQAIAIALSGIAFTKLKSYINLFGNPKQILEKSLIICALCALIIGFSQTHSFYLVMFIPFIISRTCVENYYVEVYNLKQNQKLGKDIKTITAITEIVSPLIIGSLFYLLRYNAYRLLAVGTIAGIYFIVKTKENKVLKSETNIDVSKENEAVEKNKDK